MCGGVVLVEVMEVVVGVFGCVFVGEYVSGVFVVVVVWVYVVGVGVVVWEVFFVEE